VFIHDLHPQAGPTTGKTRLEVKGIGLNQFKRDDGKVRTDVPLYVKFVDQDGKLIGNVSSVTDFTNDKFVWYTPKAKEGTKATLMVSWNK